ncbi:MAG: hypothetical protein OEY59_13085 [Deltaproteobacteria bacterium]|nr:hypothetical protein [Deltaproteobacteria bacterium]
MIFNSTSYALEIQLPPLEGMESGETDNAWEKPQKKLEIKIVVEAEATIDSSEDASGKR